MSMYDDIKYQIIKYVYFAKEDQKFGAIINSAIVIIKAPFLNKEGLTLRKLCEDMENMILKLYSLHIKLCNDQIIPYCFKNTH